jgi:hypothetical protein
MKKKALVFVIILIFAVLTVGLLKNRNSQPTSGLTRIENYSHIEKGHAACDALMPECGLCIGEVIDKECYVDKTKLSEQELKYMGLN